VAKNIQIRADDFATSSSAVTVKSYSSSTSYDFYIPSKDPKFLDGASGDLQVANQIYTYDVTSQAYEWKQAPSSQLFLQGQTDALGSDEHGNVMTILKEVRVVAGDPFYDPSLTEDQQVFKATYQFTDQMYNMKQLTSGKKQIRTSFSEAVSGITFNGTTATATIASGHSLVNGTSITIAGVTGGDEATYNGTYTAAGVTLTTFEFTMDTTPTAAATNAGITVDFIISSGVDHDKSTGLYFDYVGAEPAGSVDEKKQALDTLTLQTKKTTAGSDHTKFTIQPLQTQLSTVDSSSATKSSVTLSQAMQELEFTSDSAKFSVDNTVKKMATDMDTIEFGPSSEKHRLAVNGSKLYIQKYDGTSWVGADIVVDANVAITGTISVDSATNANDGKIDVTVSLGGTYSHWYVKIDDGSESIVDDGSLTFQLDSTYIGRHQVVAYAAAADNSRVSEYAVFSIVTTK
jgi:hypothetical protein